MTPALDGDVPFVISAAVVSEDGNYSDLVTDTVGGVNRDDDISRLTIEDTSGVEGTALVFTVTVDVPVDGAFTVDATFAGGSATAGSDYDATSIQLSFAGTSAGETQTFSVPSTDDDTLEASETFTVSLQASNGLIEDGDTAIGTITDDDSTGPQLRRWTSRGYRHR